MLDNTDAVMALLARRTETTEEGCWTWQGARTPDGYGNTRFKGKMWRVHRLSYAYLRGDIDTGAVVHHVCGNRACANPLHLEQVSQQENVAEHFHRRALMESNVALRERLAALLEDMAVEHAEEER